MIPKIWGTEETLHAGPDYWMKMLTFIQGASGSLHYHKVKDETWYVTEGSATVELVFDPQEFRNRIKTGEDPENVLYDMAREGSARGVDLMEGDTLNIPVCVAHRVTATSPRFSFIEASDPHNDEDVYRLIPGKRPKG